MISIAKLRQIAIDARELSTEELTKKHLDISVINTLHEIERAALMSAYHSATLLTHRLDKSYSEGQIGCIVKKLRANRYKVNREDNILYISIVN